LVRLAKRTADQVKRSGQPVFLEPMPAFERKQIHAVLAEDPYIKTHSEGDDPYRYLVVEKSGKPVLFVGFPDSLSSGECQIKRVSLLNKTLNC